MFDCRGQSDSLVHQTIHQNHSPKVGTEVCVPDACSDKTQINAFRFVAQNTVNMLDFRSLLQIMVTFRLSLKLKRQSCVTGGNILNMFRYISVHWCVTAEQTQWTALYQEILT